MPPFTLCLNTSTIRPTPLGEKIRIAQAAGYQAIELWCDDVQAHVKSGGSLAEVRRWLDDAGLQRPSMIALFNWMDSKDGPEKQAAFDEADRRMEIAAALGVSHIVASPVPDRDELDVPRSAARYRELLEMGQKIGVTPAVEFLGFFHNLYRLDQAVRVARASEHPEACIVLDPFHLYRGRSGFEGIREIPATMVGICHFNDAPISPACEDQTDADRVYPGDGVLPLAKMLRDLQDADYRGALSLELFNPGYWNQDPRAVAGVGLAKMLAVIDQALQMPSTL